MDAIIVGHAKKAQKICKQCGKTFVNENPHANNVVYCSKFCQRKFHYHKTGKEWQKNKRAEFDEDKIQCPICGGWYVQICSHGWGAHRVRNSEFKEMCGRDLKRGYIPEEYRELKADIAKINGTALTGAEGVDTRFKKGDKVGVYDRSPQTQERLKKLYTLTTAYKQRNRLGKH